MITVLGSKYRELLNILEREQQRSLPKGCREKRIFQCVDDLNVINYQEVWDDLDLLIESMRDTRFEFVSSAIKTLSSNWNIEILEPVEGLS